MTGGQKQVDPFYSSAAWRELRAKVRAKWRQAGQPPCPICRQPVTGTPIVDHVIPRRKRPDLALAESNLRVVCHPCNSKKAAWSDNSSKVEIGVDGFPKGGSWG